MVKYREILRLRAMGASQQNTAHSCGCAASTVQEVEKHARVAGLEWPLPEEVDDAAIRARLYPRSESRSAKFPIDHEEVDAELMRRGMTLTLCWNEYREEAVASGGGPYRYSAFCQRHRKWAEANAFTMRVGRKCGEEIEADWAGDPMEHHDPDTGLACKARVFVACLPWSQHTFAEAFPDMGEESWTAAHVHAFAFLGGSTPIPVPDSCRTGILKNTVEELVVNEQYRRMAEHYGCAVVPAGPRRPRDKGSVEAAVGLVGRQAIAPLRDRALLSLAGLNAALAAKVAAINARPFQERGGSRGSGHLGQEGGSLIPLPAHPYGMVVHKPATVQLSYHVAFEGMFYSVPSTCLRKKADVAATATAVAVDGVRVATHPRLHGAKGQYSTNPGHMPDAHRDYAEWNGDRFRRWAARLGRGRRRRDAAVAHRRAAGLPNVPGLARPGTAPRGRRPGGSLLEGARVLAQPQLQDGEDDSGEARGRQARRAGRPRVPARQRLLRRRGRGRQRRRGGRGRRGGVAMAAMQPTMDRLFETRMTTMARAYRDLDGAPGAAEMDFDELLAMIVGAEWDARRVNKRMRLLRQAAFSAPDANIADVRYDPDRKLDRGRIADLAGCGWIRDARNVVTTGATGPGKTWIGRAPGVAACNSFLSVRYVRLPEMLDDPCVKKDEEWAKVKKKYVKCDLLVIDGWMLEPLRDGEAREVLEIVEARNARGSLMLCSQFGAGGWAKKLGGNAIAEATVDRIVHSSHVIHIEGDESMRKRMSDIG